MEFVQPIRDKSKIDEMKRELLTHISTLKK